jgi:hypothetical protein
MITVLRMRAAAVIRVCPASSATKDEVDAFVGCVASASLLAGREGNRAGLVRFNPINRLAPQVSNAFRLAFV